MKEKAIKFINKNIQDNELENKTIIITGGNSGIGFESAKICAYLKMNVIIACRSESRGKEAIKHIKEEIPDAKISLMKVDLSEEKSIIAFVNEIVEKKMDIDIFYHNAGVYRLPFELKENRDIITSSNYYGPFMMNSLLLPYLKSLNHDVKMIITSSVATEWSNFRIDPLEPNPKVSKMTRYSNSKRLDAYLFKYLFDNDKSNVKYYLVHPGIARTALFGKAYKNKIFLKAVNALMVLIANPAWKSALPIVLVLAKDAEEGAFYGPGGLFNFKGMPNKNNFINRYYKGVNEIILRTESILNYKLIK